MLDDPAALHVLQYERCMIRSREVVASTTYTGNETRDSTHILYKFKGLDLEDQLWACVVRRYLLIKYVGAHGQVSNVKPLRLAIIDCYSYDAQWCPKDCPDLGKVWKVPLVPFSDDNKDYPVFAEHMSDKVTFFDEGGHRYMAMYRFNSKIL